MSRTFNKMIGDYVRVVHGGAGTLTAGGAGDNTEVDCAYFDRISGANAEQAQSVLIIVSYTTTLTDTKTFSLASFNIQDATTSGGAGVADYGTALGATTLETSSGGGTVTGKYTIHYKLDGAERFVRAQIKPDLNNTATDTASWTLSYVVPATEIPSSTADAEP